MNHASNSVSPSARPSLVAGPVAGIVLLVIGVLLTVLPLGSGVVALFGLAGIWAGFYAAMHRSPAVIRRWATLMAAIAIWFGLAAVSGSLARWTAGSAGRAAERGAPSSVSAEGANLQAEVRFTGAQFLISNHSRQPWQGVSIRVNSEPSGGGYELHADRVAPGATMALAPSRLVDPGGTPFNAVRTKPRELVVSARLGDSGASGSYEVRW